MLSKLSIAGTSPVAPIAIPGPSGLISADGGDAVWHDSGGSTIYRMPLAGGATTSKSVAPLTIRQLTWDAQNYYFMTSGSSYSDLYSVPR